MDFDQVVQEFIGLSNTAKATLMQKMINTLSPSLARTVIRYGCIRLDSINSKFPEGSEQRKRYKQYLNRRRTSTV